MADKKIWLGMSILVLTLSLMGIACSSDIPDNTDINDNTPQATSYISGDYELIITENTDRAASRAAYSPQSGDSYDLNLAGITKSSGTVSIAESNFTFSPSSKEPVFTAVLESESLKNITPVTLDDGTEVILPPIKNKRFHTEDTGTQIAGCAYNRTDEYNELPETESITHYLLSGTYDQVLSQLSTQWGGTYYPGGYNMDWDGTADAAKHNRGVLLEVSNDGGGYRLLRWTEGRWISVTWSNPDNAEDTGTTIGVGGPTYIQKEVFNGYMEETAKFYVLSIPYDEALSRLSALWGNPGNFGGLGEKDRFDHTEVVFQIEIIKAVDSSSFTTYSQEIYLLARYINGKWETVCWITE